MSLLEENEDPDPDDEIHGRIFESLCPSNMTIRSLKMPPLSKHKQIQSFLEQVQRDLSLLDWRYRGIDNLSLAERKGREAKEVIIKSSDKGGNTVLLSQDMYEKETMRLLKDETTYKKLPYNPFPEIIDALNFKLRMAFDSNLLSSKETKYLCVNKFNTPIFILLLSFTNRLPTLQEGP